MIKKDLHKVTFETKVYENDWKYLLKNGLLEEMISRCNHHFHTKTLFINNVQNREEVIKFALDKKQKGIIDKFYVVEDYAEEALNFFKIDKQSFNGGYYYSISELVSIYLCDTDYLLHFSSDSCIEKSNITWIEKAIKIFRERDDVIVANPTWNHAYGEAKMEAISENEDFFVGYGFSDQCYLIPVGVFKKDIYNENHPESERYPKYGGELFEKRVDSYMRNHKKLRITSKEISYIHNNFPLME